MDPEQFNIVHKEVNSHSRTIKEAMFICMQDPTLKQEPWEIPATSHVGPPPSGITNLTAQAFQPSNYTHPQPLTGSPHPPPTPYWWGAHTFMVGTHVCPQYTPYTPNTPHTKSTSSRTAAPSW